MSVIPLISLYIWISPTYYSYSFIFQYPTVFVEQQHPIELSAIMEIVHIHTVRQGGHKSLVVNEHLKCVHVLISTLVTKEQDF